MEEKIIIDDSYIGMRIDKAISIMKEDLSRVAIQRMIENENIKVNNKKVKVSYKLGERDELYIKAEEIKEAKLEAQDIPLDVVYEDDDIIVINKEKGMVVHPGNGNPDGTLVNAILNKCKDSLSGIGGEIRPGIVHRIDKDTSGLLIVAKNDKAHIDVSEQIKEHLVKKTYIALVRGKVKNNEATIDMKNNKENKD